jgi:hypothetical protein
MFLETFKTKQMQEAHQDHKIISCKPNLNSLEIERGLCGSELISLESCSLTFGHIGHSGHLLVPTSSN